MGSTLQSTPVNGIPNPEMQVREILMVALECHDRGIIPGHLRPKPRQESNEVGQSRFSTRGSTIFARNVDANSCSLPANIEDEAPEEEHNIVNITSIIV
ncbi:hypothetical protein WN51_00072 [Melipona quadrifasciata]|uniref:Uncharacterized protein n=1 Tax=Melipona quadrifasciata TaxID=166423 RepID=A0A0M8ZPW3_9HYME|nr:hypothetical protein WN51_00072 [Melipona quadrifasciata]